MYTEPVLEPAVELCTTGCDEPVVSCVTCSSVERGDAPVSRSNDESAPLFDVTIAGGSCNRGWRTVAGTGMRAHRRWLQRAAAKFEPAL